MENMRPIGVDHHIGFCIALGVAVARHMRPGVEYLQLITRLGCLMRNHGTGEARSNHGNFLHMSPLS